MKKLKLKSWIEGHKDEIKTESVRILWFVIGFGVAWFAGRELTTHQNAMRVLELHNVGLMKFVNPSTGLEVTIKEAYDIAKQMYD